MSWGKLRTALVEVLEYCEVTPLNDFQIKIIEAAKSGRNTLVESRKNGGQAEAFLFSVLNKIEEPSEGSPRALIICNDDQQVRHLGDFTKTIAHRLDLTVDLLTDKGNMLQQRNDLFDGTEIIIGTPKRLHDIYIQNGFNIGLLKCFVIIDADVVLSGRYYGQVKRIAESLPKCQFLMNAVSYHKDKVQEFLEEFVPVYQVVEEQL